mgnify:CR=1 FL=1
MDFIQPEFLVLLIGLAKPVLSLVDFWLRRRKPRQPKNPRQNKKHSQNNKPT